MESQTDAWMDEQTGQKYEQTDGQDRKIEGQIGGQDRKMDEWTDRSTLSTSLMLLCQSVPICFDWNWDWTIPSTVLGVM